MNDVAPARYFLIHRADRIAILDSQDPLSMRHIADTTVGVHDTDPDVVCMWKTDDGFPMAPLDIRFRNARKVCFMLNQSIPTSEDVKQFKYEAEILLGRLSALNDPQKPPYEEQQPYDKGWGDGQRDLHEHILKIVKIGKAILGLG